MMLLVFSVYDTKAQAYSRPWYEHTIPSAVRTFTDAVNEPQSPYNKHPDDFLLFHVGSFDDSSAALEHVQPVPLGCASNFLIGANGDDQ